MCGEEAVNMAEEKEPFIFNDEAVQELAGGALELADLLKSLYGPMGGRLVIGSGGLIPISVHSGNGLIREIAPESIGAVLVGEELSNLSYKEGDGTATTAILLSALLRASLQIVKAGYNPVRLQEKLEHEGTRICSWLRKKAAAVSSTSEAARLAARGEEEIQKLLCQAFEKVTEDGIVAVRDTKKRESSVDVIDCIEIDQGYISEEMAAMGQTEIALEYPYILLTDQIISKAEEIVPAMNLARLAGKPLLIMAQDVIGEALATVILNIRNGKLKSAAVRATAYGERRKEILKDIGAATGASVISKELGDRLERVIVSQLGTAESVLITRTHTKIYKGGGKKEEIRKRADKIRTEIKKSAYEADRVNLKNRLARLEGGVAIIYVGADTETEMRAKRQKLRNAVACTKSMLRGGAVPGGGSALFWAAKDLYKEGKRTKSYFEFGKRGEDSIRKRTDNIKNTEQQAIEKIWCEALNAPIRQLLKNADIPFYEAMEKLETMPYGYGCNCQGMGDCVYEDMIKIGIADSAETLCRSVEMASSLVGMIITAGAILRK